jgi:hypothetical protein
MRVEGTPSPIDTTPPVRGRPWRFWPLLALIGGIAVVAGTGATWAAVKSVTLDTDAVVRDLATTFGLDPGALARNGFNPVSQPTTDLPLTGRSDLLGLIAIAGGVIAALGGLLGAGAPTAATRRLGGWIALVGGALATIAAFVVVIAPEGLILRALESGFREQADRAFDALIPAVPVGGLITAPLVGDMVDVLMRSLEVDAAPATGLIVTLVGGLIAAVVGLALLVGSERDPLEPSLAGLALEMEPRERDDLLRVLTAPKDVRRDLASAFAAKPGRAGWAPFIEELFGDDRTRRRVVSSLRAAARSVPSSPADVAWR